MDEEQSKMWTLVYSINVSMIPGEIVSLLRGLVDLMRNCKFVKAVSWGETVSILGSLVDLRRTLSILGSLVYLRRNCKYIREFSWFEEKLWVY